MNMFRYLERPFYSKFEFDVNIPLDMCVAKLSQGMTVKRNFLGLYSKQLVSVERQNEHIRLIIHMRHPVYGFAPASIYMKILPLNNEQTRISGKIYAHVLNFFFHLFFGLFSLLCLLV